MPIFDPTLVQYFIQIPHIIFCCPLSAYDKWWFEQKKSTHFREKYLVLSYLKPGFSSFMKSFKLQFYDAFLSRPTPSPVISWIEPDGKTKWLPLNFGYHDVMCTGHIRHLGLWGTYPEKKFILRWPKPHFFLKIGIFYTKSSKLQSVQVNHLKLTNLRPWTQKTEASVGKHYRTQELPVAVYFGLRKKTD